MRLTAVFNVFSVDLSYPPYLNVNAAHPVSAWIWYPTWNGSEKAWLSEIWLSRHVKVDQ